MMEPTPYRPSVPFRRTPRSTQNHHHSATAAASSIAVARAPSRDKRRAPMAVTMGSRPTGRRSPRRARLACAHSGHDRRIRGWRGAPATRGWPGDLRSSRGPTDPLRVRVLGRRAVHDVSIDLFGVNGAILASMRRASHAFDFFNIAQFKRDSAPASSIGGRGRGNLAEPRADRSSPRQRSPTLYSRPSRTPARMRRHSGTVASETGSRSGNPDRPQARKSTHLVSFRSLWRL